MKPASSPTCRHPERRPARRPAQGFTLIDVLVLITLIGIVAGSVTVLFTRMASQSAEVMRTRQAISLAQALMNEIRMMPFTTCDRNAVGCTAGAEAMGPEAGEVRYHAAIPNFNNQFDNVNDYNNLQQPGPGCAGICDIRGTLLNPAGSTLAGCTSRVAVAPQAMAGVPAAEALLISVTVTCPGMGPLMLQGMRTRHAPNAY
ncbi:MAG: type II secretion system protein [Rubrivivax sp.]|nr:MAG: type II secretion system protein [Rubrivivax sp.]